MTKILYAPGYGAGWSTWSSSGDEQKRFMLTYAPLIEAIEKDEDVGYLDNLTSTNDFTDAEGFFDTLAYYRSQCVEGSALDRFVIDYFGRFNGEDLPYLGGASDLEVADVDRPFCIAEYDGSESIEYLHADSFI